MRRRELLKGLSLLPVAGTVSVSDIKSVFAGSPLGSKSAVKSIYEAIGVRPLINGRGTVTIVGASQILPEVQYAMDEAVKEYVQIDELMDAVGARLGELTGTEFGYVSSGASAAITAGSAACVTGGDPDKLWMIPDLRGMKDEVIIPAYSRTAYDAAAKAVGVRMVEVNTLDDLKLAIGPRTAMILVLAGGRSENGPLSLKEISSVAKPLGVPILVDAAAEVLEVPNPHISQGADLVAYSGGKYIRGPQCAGLLLGRKDLIIASRINAGPHHGFGRGFKVGREEIMGMLAAVETWFRRDHAAEWKTWVSYANHIIRALSKVPGVSTQLIEPKGRSNRAPSVSISWDKSIIPLTGEEMEGLLWDGTPRIAVSGAGSFLPFPPNLQPNISVQTSSLQEGEEKIIADRIFAILTKPPQISKVSGAADFDLSGQWNLTMKFSASSVEQTLIIEQEGNEFIGTHIASIGSRDLEGSLHGKMIVMRSSYTKDGVRINYTFTGTAEANTMQGKVSLSEYGDAEWTARRHEYRPAGVKRKSGR
ncbi:MAG: aminotransferase class V-fold PLP-dependent enzyme [Bacteroidetes bacterium]|nr:aminotransferase class V-fold PLP-dependent enzyme [Bacteroidota bacterium]